MLAFQVITFSTKSELEESKLMSWIHSSDWWFAFILFFTLLFWPYSLFPKSTFHCPGCIHSISAFEFCRWNSRANFKGRAKHQSESMVVHLLGPSLVEIMKTSNAVQYLENGTQQMNDIFTTKLRTNSCFNNIWNINLVLYYSFIKEGKPPYEKFNPDNIHEMELL